MKFFKKLTFTTGIIGLVGLIIYGWLGTISTDYLTEVFTTTDFATIIDLVIGLAFGSVLIPLALAVWILIKLGLIKY